MAHQLLQALPIDQPTVTELNQLRGSKVSRLGSRQARARHPSQFSQDPHVDYVRRNTTVTGKGITVVVVESDKLHGNAVQSKIVDSKVGIAPGAKTKLLMLKAPALPTIENTKAGLDKFIIQIASGSLKLISEKLLSVLKMSATDPSIRVVNFSGGISKADLLEQVILELKANRLTEWGAAIVSSKNAHSDSASQLTAMLNYIDERLASSKSFQLAQSQYKQIVQKLYQKNISVVVAAGNANPGLLNTRGLQEGEHLTLQSVSPHVIVVGGSKFNGTPGKFSDDSTWEFTPSTGKRSGKINSHILAPAESIAVNVSSSSAARYEKKTGNSYATPFVAGTIALMLEQNPQLTAKQIVAHLKNSCVPLKNTSSSMAGSGALNALAALKATKK